MMQKLRNLAEISLKKFFGIFGRELSDEQCNAWMQFVMFGLVGVSNTVVSYVINVLTLLFLRRMNLSWDFVIGNAAAFLLSVLWSFYWNGRYVFARKRRQDRKLGRTLLKTYISYGFTGIILNNALSFIWIVCLHISKYIAPVLNLFLSIPLNFFMNKLWVYKE